MRYTTQQVITANVSLQSMRKKAHVTTYSDGFATDGTTAGGAEIVATLGDSAETVVIHTPKIRGAELAFSYEELKATIFLALEWTRANCPTERIAIYSDN